MLAVLTSPLGGPLAWSPNDLDIYGTELPNGYQCPHCGSQFSSACLFGEYLCLKGFRNEVAFAYPVLGILDNRTWTKNQRKINEIIIDKSITSLKQFVFDTFDFDFCKIVYDGATLSVFDPQSVMTRHCIYRGDYEALKYFTNQMEDKYYESLYYQRNREYDFRMERLYRTYKIRLSKYKERGFTICCQFDFGKRFIKDSHTEGRTTEFITAINGLFGTKRIRLEYKNAKETAFKLTKEILSHFHTLDHNVLNRYYIKPISSRPVGTSRVSRLIKEYFPCSDYYIDAHPSREELVIFLTDFPGEKEPTSQFGIIGEDLDYD